MKILFVWDSVYPWDIRVEKVCNSLMRRGHEIHLVCRNPKYQVRNELYRGIHLHRIGCLPKYFRKLNGLFTFPFFLSPVWLLEIYSQARSNSCDMIMVRDLPMAPAALIVGKLLGLPVILDMAECYPELLRCTWKFEKFRLSNLLTRNPYVADIIEKLVIDNIDEVLVMIEESRDRLLQMNVDSGKIHIVSNTPELDRFASCAKVKDRQREDGKALKMVYVGLLNPSRGIDTLLLAVKEYVNGGRKIELTIAGSGKDENRLKEITAQNGLEAHVSFLGWVDNSEVPRLVAESDICIVPHHKCTHWDTTIPNKLFDYMAAGKPVLVSNVTPMERIVNENRCGLSYEDLNPADLAAKIVLLEDVNLRRGLGENARKAITAKYRWDLDEKVLDKVMAKFCKEQT